jgi:hypothetical protein
VVAVLALAAPAAARAELVAPGVSAGALAVAADGAPRVAYVQGRELVLATRAETGWTSGRAATLPGPAGSVAGIAVSASGRVAVLAEAANGRWLVLYERTAATTRLSSLLPRLPAGARIGRAGLALDGRGLPVVAYAEWRPSGRTFLRLVRLEGRRYRPRPVTRRGFPPSDVPPAAAPVLLRNGSIRVVEAYGGGRGGSAAIDWMPQRADWLGQFLYSSPLAALVGGVSAAAAQGGVYAAWTVGFPQLGKLGVVLARHGTPVETALALDDAVLAGLALGAQGPVLAATAVVATVEGALTAALVRGSGGTVAELDGAAASIAAVPAGSQQVLLVLDGALQWFALPVAPLPRVTLAASPAPGGVALTGTVEGAAGSVTIYRERAGAPRVAIASAPLAPDGSFSAFDAAPAGPAFYRAVFTEPRTGLPAASLLRSPVGGG